MNVKTLTEKLRNRGGMQSFNPMYSVFRTDNVGNYYSLYNGRVSADAAEAIIRECQQPFAVGVEVRIDGVKFDWN